MIRKVAFGIVVAVLVLSALAPRSSRTQTHNIMGMGPGEFVVVMDSLDASGALIFKVRELSPDSVYFFPRRDLWDAYIMGGNATTWASCYGLTGWNPVRSIDTPGYIALEYRGWERYAVTFVYFNIDGTWDGTYDLIVKQEDR